MPKRTIYVQRPAHLTVKNKSLVIDNENGRCRIPLEDIWVLILEERSISVGVALLSSLADAGIGTMICGENHMPNGLYLPLGAHSRHSAIVEDQLAIPKPLKKQLWRRIVQSKIGNQARCLDFLGVDGGDALRVEARKVLSGDTTNREAVAAAEYFRRLIPNATRRNGPYTAALDYGYAVLRAGIGRCAVAGGWLVSKGLFHSNDLNAFNLVDDLLEPFRPVVDLVVFARGLSGELTPKKKRELASVFEYLVIVGGKKHNVQSAIEAELDGLKAAVVGNDPAKLVLPMLIPLERCEVEGR